jgi:hypothetical protein
MTPVYFIGDMGAIGKNTEVLFSFLYLEEERATMAVRAETIRRCRI